MCRNISQKSSAFSPHPEETGGRMSEKTKDFQTLKTHCCHVLSKRGSGARAAVIQVVQSALRSTPTSEGRLGSLDASRPSGLKLISAELCIYLGLSWGLIQKYIRYIKTQFCSQLWIPVRSHLKGLKIPETELRYVAGSKQFFSSRFNLSC